jgi:hypothetical protein
VIALFETGRQAACSGAFLPTMVGMRNRATLCQPLFFATETSLEHQASESDKKNSKVEKTVRKISLLPIGNLGTPKSPTAFIN